MKRYSILFLVIALFSCNDKKNETDITEEEVTVMDSTGTDNPGAPDADSKLYIWRSTADYKKIKNEAAPSSIVNTDSLIKGLNQHYENVYLEKLKQNGDTLFTRIKDGEYLSQQMGSTGAKIYLADVVLNLTSVHGIRYVKIEMQEGDHMGPGLWSADNFKNYTQVTQ